MKWLGVGLAGLLLLALLVLAARVVFYRQTDDDERVASKRAYLDSLASTTRPTAAEPLARPNVVIILFDDLGYGDIGAYGARSIRTPRIDRLAAEGALFRHGYSASPYCSGSRAGLMTGRYPLRSGLDHVLQPAGTWQDTLLKLGWLNRRLPAEEITIADALRAAGYATGIFGKWHLGDVGPSLPNDLGFDAFYGLLHSNDQGEPVVWRDREVDERHPIDQTTLTRRYTERAVRFIEANRDLPFFLYMPHTFPHVPLHVGADRRGHSPGGLYGDVVEELDWSVGEVVDALERHGLADSTLVVVSSDNGPWFQGSGGGTRGRKFDVFEGGMRVPLIARWPGTVGAGTVVDEPVISLDLFPTILEIAALPPPDDRRLDGRSLLGLFRGDGSGDREPIFFFQIAELRAVRDGRFKYHDRHGVPFGNPMDWPWGPMRDRGPWLFDLALDPDESYDVTDKHPETAARLGRALATMRESLAANPRGWIDASR